ncbi:MAG: type II toxin-antitoxin system RelE/ParE family toxin [Bryobacterales bacterium]|nr:type II toxin-antitoxin system RelE/ParE family toxin [Acidobacteriota bacterium]MCB9384028.1 type II toxin-antitoxin system RelE/ParE family toxin [Bryobacterales bacterium]
MPEWRAELARSAAKQLAALDAVARKRVRACIDRLPEGDVKKLKGQGALFRARAGDMRVLFQIDSSTQLIQVTAVLPRDKAYQ